VRHHEAAPVVTRRESSGTRGFARIEQGRELALDAGIASKRETPDARQARRRLYRATG
jgi:hypothetical protein